MNNGKKASSKDVAVFAGVSRATVSAYLNKTRYVSPELSEKIKNAIAELDYIPDPLARALKTSDSKTIGLVIPILSKFYTPLIKAINYSAQKHGYDLIISSSEEDPVVEKKLINMLISKRLSGLLLAPCSEENKEFLEQIKIDGLPVVQVNRRIDGADISSVVSDNFGAAYQVTELLIKKGIKKIAYLGHDSNMLTNNEKKRGYDQALTDHNIINNLTIEIKEHDPEQIFSALEDFIESGIDFDGLIATSQGKTSIALKVLQDKKIEIPKKVSVIGFDDTLWSGLVSPPLTVISESTFEMGEKAVDLLLKNINSDGKDEVVHILLEDELIQRRSV